MPRLREPEHGDTFRSSESYVAVAWPQRKGETMYIGIGTVLVVLLILLIIGVLR
jgi:hypothetical protein